MRMIVNSITVNTQVFCILLVRAINSPVRTGSYTLADTFSEPEGDAQIGSAAKARAYARRASGGDIGVV